MAYKQPQRSNLTSDFKSATLIILVHYSFFGPALFGLFKVSVSSELCPGFGSGFRSFL